MSPSAHHRVVHGTWPSGRGLSSSASARTAAAYAAKTSGSCQRSP
ncbi:hypothetical protein ACGRHY_18545 [Streptomyces sp. HK10]